MTEFNALECSHMVERVEKTEDIKGVKIGTQSGENIFKYLQMFGHCMYYFTPKNEEDPDLNIVGYGMTESDLVAAFGAIGRTKSVEVLATTEGSETGSFYRIITQETMTAFQKTKSTNVKIYIGKRLIFPEDEETIRQDCTKKIEFESTFILCKHLASKFVFNFQVNILNYRVDQFIECRDNLGIDIPPIGIEIDEDHHKSYDKLSEEKRQQVVEYFGAKLVRVPIKRGMTDGEMHKILKKTSDNVMAMMRDLVIDYSTKIDEERLYEILETHCVDREFISMFVNGTKTSPYDDLSTVVAIY